MTPRFSTRSLLLATIVIAVLSSLYVWFRPGVTVSIHNKGSMEMKELVVDVNGRSYKLGNVAAGATKSYRIGPLGNPQVEISYMLVDGAKKHHVVDQLLEWGYRGRIYFECCNGELIQESIKLSQ